MGEEVFFWGPAWYYAFAWGILGAIVAEGNRFFYNRRTLPGGSYIPYLGFAFFCGGLFAILFEPGNKLGAFGTGVGWLAILAKIVKVEPSAMEIMRMLGSGDFVKVNQMLEDAKKILDKENIELVPVVDEQGKLVGIITDGQYERAVKAGYDPAKTKIEEFLNPKPVSVKASNKVGKTYEMLAARKVKQAPVTDEAGEVIGYIDMPRVQSAQQFRHTLL